uniref:Uncharacterized protein n=1 Tax=Oryza punctata TaxID=4537 RepID=A0A0E0M4Y9_ORYPU
MSRRRLRRMVPSGKLAVDCTEEGVVLVATAPRTSDDIARTWSCSPPRCGGAARRRYCTLRTGDCVSTSRRTRGRRMRRRHGVHIPEGYYGNALAYSIVHASAGELCGGTLCHTVELVCEAKLRITEEYVRSTVDSLASLRQRGRALVFDGVYVVSDATRLVGELDFGCAGEWVGAGVAQPMRGTFLGNGDGEDAVAASMLLPPPAMDKFACLINNLPGKNLIMNNYKSEVLTLVNGSISHRSRKHVPTLYATMHILVISGVLLDVKTILSTPENTMASRLIARRSKPELVAPSRPTPHDTKLLSDLDDFRNHYEYTPLVAFFRSSGGGNVPSAPPPEMSLLATTLRTALAEALVYYYPLAGRLRELPCGKLAVDCTEEGVVFVAAEADLRLADLAEPLLLPFPRSGELLVHDDVGDSQVAVVDTPLIFMQVTEFKCGGFAVAMQWNHCVADGFGASQFMNAIADLARGEPRPLVLPVWERHLLMARAPPSIAAAYPAFKPLIDGSTSNDVMLTTPVHGGMVTRHFLFGRREIAALRRHLPARLGRRCTDFQLLAAALWRCRTAALPYVPHRRVRAYLPLSTRGRRWRSQGLNIPEGYYGNALAYSIADASAGDLCGGTLGQTVELVCEARLRVTDEYVRSTVDLMASLRGRAMVFDGVYVVSDLTRLFAELDIGRGKWVVSGMAQPMLATFLVRCRSPAGEDAVAASMVLPPPVMERFAEELAGLMTVSSSSRL